MPAGRWVLVGPGTWARVPDSKNLDVRPRGLDAFADGLGRALDFADEMADRLHDLADRMERL